MDEALRAALDNLRGAVERSEADGVIDDAERDELRRLVAELADALEEPNPIEGLVDQLEESAIRFDADHPTLAGVIRSVVDTLVGYGI